MVNDAQRAEAGREDGSGWNSEIVNCELSDLVAEVVRMDGFGTLPLIHNSPFTISSIP